MRTLGRATTCAIAVLVATSIGASSSWADNTATDESIVVARACGYPKIRVRATRQEQIEDLCAAMADIKGFLLTLAFKFDADFSVVFRSRAPAASRQPSDQGWFNQASREIVVYELTDDAPWGITSSRVLVNTILRHELAHMAVTQILGSNSLRLQREWHEFIAYAIQFELMPADLRARILDRYAHVRPADDLRQINAMTYRLADPSEFGVLAYKSYQVHGRTALIRRLITFEIEPPPLFDIQPPVVAQ
jgi:hypothetical protein